MPFGAGHNMNNQIQQNRAERTSNRERFKENVRDAIYEKKTPRKKPSYKKATKEKLAEIKLKIQESVKDDLKRERVIICSSIVLSFITLYGLGQFISYIFFSN